MKRILLSTVLGMSLWTLLAAPGHAIVRRHDVADSSYRTLGQSADFTAVGLLNLTGGFCTASLIAPRFVLTAAHCVTGTFSPTTFVVGGNTFNVVATTVHPGWTGDLANGNDIAVLELASAVTGITPLGLFSGGGEIGLTATHIGFGTTGTGLTGGTTIDQVKRGANNVIDIFGDSVGFDPNILISDFDNPDGSGNTLGAFGSSATALGLEGSVAPGDSGGPLLLNVGGIWQIAGVHSFIGVFNPPLGDGNNNASYSDIMGSARVTAFAPFINGVVGSAAAPEPGTLALLAIGAVALRRRRRSE